MKNIKSHSRNAFIFGVVIGAILAYVYLAFVK